LHPLHRVSVDVGPAVAVLIEQEPIEFPRLSRLNTRASDVRNGA
jgi:hypothetical protein